jgi:hypothetical protein
VVTPQILVLHPLILKFNLESVYLGRNSLIADSKNNKVIFFRCMECPSETSYSLALMNEPGECKKCPTDFAICLGGSNIGPKPGFWRRNNQTANFIKCVNP